MIEDLLMSAPCRNAACELIEKAPFLAAVLGSLICGLIGFRLFLRRTLSKTPVAKIRLDCLFACGNGGGRPVVLSLISSAVRLDRL
jgi:hypothetical protein